MTCPISYISIERLRIYCKEDAANRILGYYYFTFADGNKQNVSNLLRSLISDLCPITRDLPKAVQQLHDTYLTKTPPLSELLETFWSLIQGSGQVYIVIDALDECGASLDELERSDKWKELLELLSRLTCLKDSNLHLLVTSRDGESANIIDEELKKRIKAGVNRYDIMCRGDGFDHDIETLIKSRVLKDDEYWGDLEPELKQGIIAKLKDGAKGMYVTTMA